MTLRCIRSHKPLTRPALSILTRRGCEHWGPKCARKAGRADIPAHMNPDLPRNG